MRREQLNLFLFDGDYISQTYRGTGWLVRFVADFLEQFFHLPVAGPLIVALVLTVLCLSFAFWQRSDYRKADSAIVTRPVTTVQSSPGRDSAKDLFVLHEGTKVKLLDSVGSWRNIELADGRQGWLPSSDLEVI